MSEQKTVTYEVTAPDGTVLEVDGPEGASQDEVIKQAMAGYKPSKPLVIPGNKQGQAVTAENFPGRATTYMDTQGPLTRAATGVAEFGRDAVQGVASAARHPLDFLTGALTAQTGTLQKAMDAPTTGEKVGYGLASLIPILGPAAANIGENIGATGDVAGGIGQGAALAASSVPATEAAGKVASGAKSAGRALVDTLAVKGVKKLADTAAKAPKDTLFDVVKTHVSPDFYDTKLDTAIDQLKTAEGAVGKINTVDQALKGFEHQHRVNEATVTSVVEANRGVAVPGSGDAIAESMRNGIPKSLRIQDAKAAARYDKQASQYAGRDFTIPELNELRKEFQKKKKAYFDADRATRAGMDDTLMDMYIQGDDVIRQQMYDGISQYGRDGAEGLRQANQRIGANMEMESALRKVSNEAKSQAAKTPTAKRIEALGQWASPAETFKKAGVGQLMDLNESIASALRRHQKTSEPVTAGVRGIAPASRQLGPGATRLDMQAPSSVRDLGADIESAKSVDAAPAQNIMEWLKARSGANYPTTRAGNTSRGPLPKAPKAKFDEILRQVIQNRTGGGYP